MGYDYKKEYIRWKEWKDREEKILRQHHFNEQKIEELHEFDLEQFNAERRFRRNQNVTKDIFFYMQPVHDKKESYSIEDLLDQIENETLFEYLKYTDSIVLDIIILKQHGYNVREISQILGLSMSSIYRKIKKNKRTFKNVRKKDVFVAYIVNPLKK